MLIDFLCNLFNGKFAFLPFIITENEFRIPVAVDDGINHEDITTMSSAEIMLLSMIISISLLSQTSTKLNIIVGDELDGPFDGDNRRGFFDILYKLMTLVSATQCVLISHNTELPSDCDVIILKMKIVPNEEMFQEMLYGVTIIKTNKKERWINFHLLLTH